MNTDEQDPSRLLSDEGQWTEPWGSSEDGSDCDKCKSTGTTLYDCWSCVLTGSRPACPVCSGRVRWEDRCPVCRGTGRVDGQPRHGVSVFPTLAGLYQYMLGKGTDLGRCVIVELEGERADDVDFDADQGAMLVIPTAILGCGEVDHELVAEIRSRGAERGAA